MHVHDGGPDRGGNGDVGGSGELGDDGGQKPQIRSHISMKLVCLHLVILSMSAPTAFRQYSGSLDLFLSMHGDGGGGVGGMGGGQRGAQPSLHLTTAGWLGSMLGQVPPRAWHLCKQGHWISWFTQPGLGDSSEVERDGSGDGVGGGGDGVDGGGGAEVAT